MSNSTETFKVGDKVKFNRSIYKASQFDSPELLEIVAKEVEGYIEVAHNGRPGSPFDFRIIFPKPSPFKTPGRPKETIAVNANADELTMVERTKGPR